MSEQTEPSLVIVGARRGRPRVEEPRVSVSSWIPESQYDKLVRLANKREQSVSSLVKDLLKLRITNG